MPLFRKDFSIFSTREKTIKVPPQYAAPSTTVVPPTPHQLPLPPPPQPTKRPETTYHSTLFLLDKLGLSQEPEGYWDGKVVEETPSSRNAKGRPVFDPETRARRVQYLLLRDANARKAEAEALSQEEGWLESQAPSVARALEEIEDTRCEIREVGRWENIYLTVREERRAPSRTSWFGKESDDEKRCRLAVEVGKNSIRGPEWTREYEPQSPTQLASSAAFIRSQKSHRRTTSSSSFTAASLSPSDTRNSILSTTTRSTPRSSIMSMAHSVSTVSSPISSGMPSPTLSTSSGKGGMWKDTEKAHRMSLPPPAAI